MNHTNSAAENYSSDLLHYFSNILESLQMKHNGNHLPKEKIEEIGKHIGEFASILCSKDEENRKVIELVTACFRILRNACAGCSDNQQAIPQATFLDTNNLFIHLVHLLETVTKEDRKPHHAMVCLRCGVQFLGNAATRQNRNQQLVWHNCGDTLKSLFRLEDEKLCDYTSMVIFTCYTEWINNSRDLLRDILSVLVEYNSEWALLICERLLREEECLSFVCSHPDSDVREAVLELINEKLKSQEKGEVELKQEPIVHKSNVLSACAQFKSDAHTILGLSQHQVSDLKPISVTQLLSILCTATTQRQLYKEIIDDSDLLICAINLLHCMQMIGADGDNAFSNVAKLSEMEKTDHSVHPVFGLKSNLIRLLSNMVYKHRQNQDLVREKGGIQLIMNHTNIDGRNPFITQWAVFAMRNLLEDNEENKAVVSELKLEGISDNLEALREFGVEAELEGDRLVIKRVTDPELNEPSPFSKPD